MKKILVLGSSGSGKSTFATLQKHTDKEIILLKSDAEIARFLSEHEQANL